MTQKKVRGHGAKVPVKRDRRTKAELIKQLNIMIDTNTKLIEKEINPPAVMFTDSDQFESGYKAGVKAQQEWHAEHPWYRFW